MEKSQTCLGIPVLHAFHRHLNKGSIMMVKVQGMVGVDCSYDGAAKEVGRLLEYRHLKYQIAQGQ